MDNAKNRVQKLPDEHRQVVNVIINAPNKHITKEKILNQLGYDTNSTKSVGFVGLYVIYQQITAIQLLT